MCPPKVTICRSVIHLHFASSFLWFHMTIDPTGNIVEMYGQSVFLSLLFVFVFFL